MTERPEVVYWCRQCGISLLEPPESTCFGCGDDWQEHDWQELRVCDPETHEALRERLEAAEKVLVPALRMIEQGNIAGMWCNARSGSEIAREVLSEWEAGRE